LQGRFHEANFNASSKFYPLKFSTEVDRNMEGAIPLLSSRAYRCGGASSRKEDECSSETK
jgi:hypothetical protein